MLSSINFLFLSALAITTWVILCYLKQIEEQRNEDNNATYSMEPTLEETLTPCHENYDIYLNFFCIFGCIYALARVTCMTENYVGRKLMARFVKSGEQPTLEEYKEKQEHLLLQIQQLQHTNVELEKKLIQSKVELETQQQPPVPSPEEQKLQEHGNKYLPDKEISDQSESLQLIQPSMKEVINNNKIFISNRHSHANRPIYINEGNVTLEPPTNKEAGDFSEVWLKYIDMQKFISKPLAKAVHAESAGAQQNTAKASMSNQLPLVVSTEQLQSLQGSFNGIH